MTIYTISWNENDNSDQIDHFQAFPTREKAVQKIIELQALKDQDIICNDPDDNIRKHVISGGKKSIINLINSL